MSLWFFPLFIRFISFNTRSLVKEIKLLSVYFVYINLLLNLNNKKGGCLNGISLDGGWMMEKRYEWMIHKILSNAIN